MLMAIGALHPVDIVRAGFIGKGRIHLLDIDAAVGHFGMAILAAGSRVFVVAKMAGQATDAFMHAHRRAVVARSNLRTPAVRGRFASSFRLARRVALIA